MGRWLDATLCRHPTPVQRSHGRGLVSLAAHGNRPEHRKSGESSDFQAPGTKAYWTAVETGYLQLWSLDASGTGHS